MLDVVIIGEKEVNVDTITKEEFVALTEADKMKILIAEKEAKLAEQDLEKSKIVFFDAKKLALAAFDIDAESQRMNLEATISANRTVIENKWNAAEALGTYIIPV